jgi:outer membrane protein W
MPASSLRVVGVLVAILLAPCVSAHAEEASWTLRLYGFFMSTGDPPLVVSDAGTRLTSDNTDAAGAGLSAEYRLDRRLGLELAAWIADHGDFRAVAASTDLGVEATDTMTNGSIGAAVNYHLTPDSMADVHVGAIVALVAYDDLALTERSNGVSSTTTASLDSDVALGLQLGVDLALPNSSWVVHGGLRYLTSTLDGSVSGGTMAPVDYDPLLVIVGFGYRF